MTFREFQAALVAQLQGIGVASPEAEAQLIIEELCDQSYLDLLTAPQFELAPTQEQTLQFWLKRRSQREPLQHILGHAWFRDLDLRVSPDVLIPRPETEILVDLLLAPLPSGGQVLDLGTGSGAIALSVAQERPDARVCACDISPAALAVAQSNAQRYHLDQVEFIHSDLFDSLGNRTFDAIAANLPYVTDEEYAELEPELNYEPRLALTAPDAGFALIERTARELKQHLTPKGRAYFELSPFQAPRLVALLHTLGYQGSIQRDLTGRDRFVVAE